MHLFVQEHWFIGPLLWSRLKYLKDPGSPQDVHVWGSTDAFVVPLI